MLDPDFQRLLANPEFRSMVMELIDFGEEDSGRLLSGI